MDLAPLLSFIPLIAGAFLAYHVVVKQQLPSKSIGAIITYFVGIFIVLLAVSFLIRQFFADWANDLLNSGINSPEWQLFIDNSEEVFQDALDEDTTTTGTVNNDSATNTVIEQVIVTATPVPGGTPLIQQSRNTYIVQQGDTLSSIARENNTTAAEIQRLNGLTNADFITIGQELILPSP